MQWVWIGKDKGYLKAQALLQIAYKDCQSSEELKTVFNLNSEVGVIFYYPHLLMQSSLMLKHILSIISYGNINFSNQKMKILVLVNQVEEGLRSYLSTNTNLIILSSSEWIKIRKLTKSNATSHDKHQSVARRFQRQNMFVQAKLENYGSALNSSENVFISDFSPMGTKLRISEKKLNLNIKSFVKIRYLNQQKQTQEVISQVRWMRQISPQEFEVGLQFVACA